MKKYVGHNTFVAVGETDVPVYAGAVPGFVPEVFLALRSSQYSRTEQRVSDALLLAHPALHTRRTARISAVQRVENESH